MKIYIARHGQILPEKYYDNDTLFPVGNQPLSKLGIEQSHYLGRYMQSLGFSGTIYSSPFTRTLQTSQIVAEYTDAEVMPAAFMHEIFKTQEAAEQFDGYNTEQILSNYDKVPRTFFIDYPWWIPQKEDFDLDVCKRVFAGLSGLRADAEKDILLLGHGASVNAAFIYYNIPPENDDPPWNCSLSMYDNVTGEMYRNDVSFIPYEKISSNITMLHEQKNCKDRKEQ